MIDLLKYCTTDHQRALVEAVGRAGNQHRAAIELGIDDSNLRKTYKAIKARAAKESLANFGVADDIPIGFSIKGVSTYKEDSNGNRHWLKIDKDKQQQEEAIRGYIEGLMADVEPRKPIKILKTIKHDPDLLTKIYIGDAHIGAYCFAKETKHSDYDSDIAVEMHEVALDYLIDRAEPSETGVIVDVGDYMHSNGLDETTRKGTQVDVDTRHSVVLFKAAMLMRYAVDKALTKFKKVVVVISRGNHNDDSALAIQLAIKFYYERDPRVNVLDSHGYYHYMEFGKWLFGTCHGDKQKPQSLAANMARDMAAAWGRTTHRLWETGHLHTEIVKGYPGVKVKTFAALTPPDGWHASMGYGGDGEMEMITYKKEGGIHSSVMYNIPQPRKEPDVTI